MPLDILHFQIFGTSAERRGRRHDVMNTPRLHLPKCRTPSRIWNSPENRDRMIAYVGSWFGAVAKAAVISDMIAVGPRVISFDVPRNV